MKDRVPLPKALQGVFFDFRWETSKSWSLPTPASILPFKDLAWHLDLTVWTTVPRQPRFDLAPTTVLNGPESYPDEWRKILSADLKFPLEMFRNGSRWVILDGYHRLARCQLEGLNHVRVRLHPDEYKARILRG